MVFKYLNFGGKRLIWAACLAAGLSPVVSFADENDAFEQEMKKAGKTREVNGEEMDQATEKETFKDRLKKSREVPKIPRNEKGGFYVGGNLGVGQAYSAEPKSSPGMSFLAGVEPGFIMQNSSFNRMEFGLMLFTGSTSFSGGNYMGADLKSVSVPLGIGLMPRFGYGYSLSPGMYGVLRVQAGMAQGRLDAKLKDYDVSLKGDPVWGFGFGMGWDMVFEVSNHFELVAGASVTHFQFNFSDVKADGTKLNESLVVNMNLPQVELGARVRF